MYMHPSFARALGSATRAEYLRRAERYRTGRPGVAIPVIRIRLRRRKPDRDRSVAAPVLTIVRP